LDEPEEPFKGLYTKDHTKAWSNHISLANGFIFVTPQYNWGYPASLKNALDFLYKEWHHKPAIIVSYAHRGGGKAAAQLRQVLEGLHMEPTPTMPALPVVPDMLTENGEIKDIEIAFRSKVESIVTAVSELKEMLKRTQ
jgi:NAD(P)H-dependent FMN reductase